MPIETSQYTFVFVVEGAHFVPLEYTTDLTSDAMAAQVGQRLATQYARLTGERISVAIGRDHPIPKVVGVWECRADIIVKELQDASAKTG